MCDNTNKNFEEYLEKYCKTYNVTPEEAKEHQLVKDVKAYYDKQGH